MRNLSRHVGMALLKVQVSEGSHKIIKTQLVKEDPVGGMMRSTILNAKVLENVL